MTPPPDPLAILGAVVAPLVALWAIVRWLFWPRIQTTIRAEVDAATAPLRTEMQEHARSMDVSIGRIASAMDKIADRVGTQGEHLAATRASVDILIDRRSGKDRRDEAV